MLYLYALSFQSLHPVTQYGGRFRCGYILLAGLWRCQSFEAAIEESILHGPLMVVLFE